MLIFRVSFDSPPIIKLGTFYSNCGKNGLRKIFDKHKNVN